MARLTKAGRFFGQLVSGLGDLLYPRLCLSCQQQLVAESATYLCLGCQEKLPYTRYHELPENPVTDRFAGRLRLRFGGAYLHYRTDTLTQRLIAQLKYYNRPDIARDLGALYGSELKQVAQLQDLDMIVPVPLHPKRRHDRGYNQAEQIGLGMSTALQCPCLPKTLIRNTFESSQTKKGQAERFENVAETFRAGRNNLNGKHLLLVDDVLTTGATLEACCEAILRKYPEAIISLATLAIRE